MSRTTLDMLRSIHGQEAARRVRALNGPHRRAARDYATRYARGADALALAAEVDIPVCSLLRLLLETLLGMKPPSSGKALRDPSRVPSPLPPLTELGLSPSETAAFTRERLVADIQRAVAWVRTSRRRVGALEHLTPLAGPHLLAARRDAEGGGGRRV